MSISDWMNRSFKNWLSVGAPLLIALALLVAIFVRAVVRISWSEVVLPALWFGIIQILSFSGMYFARKYGKVHNNPRIAFLVSGSYCLAIGLLVIHYSAGWGLIQAAELRGNYEMFTTFVVGATLILMLLPLDRKS